MGELTNAPRYITQKYAKQLATEMLDGSFAERDIVILDPGSNYEDDGGPTGSSFLMPGALKISFETLQPDGFARVKLQWIDPENGEVMINIAETVIHLDHSLTICSDDIYWPMKLE